MGDISPTFKKASWFGWFVCLLAALFYCYEYLLRISPSVMSAGLMNYYHVSATGFGWLSDAYLVSYTSMQLFVGPTTDYFGLRRMLMMALVCCVVGSFIFAMAFDFPVAIMGRLLIGFGSAFAFVGVLRMASVWLQPRYFPFFSGIATALGMVGAMLGDVIMVHFVKVLGWPDVVYFTALIGCVLIPLFYFFIVEKSVPNLTKKRFDQQILKKIIKVFKNKQVLLVGFMGCFMFSSLSVFSDIWGIAFFQSVFRFSNETAAVANSMVYFGWLVGGPVIGVLSQYLGSRRWFIFIGCFGAGCVFLVLLFCKISAVWAVFGLIFLFGLFSSAEILCFVVGKESVSDGYIATAIGMVNFIIMFGGMLLLPLVSRLLDLFWSGGLFNQLRIYSPEDYRLSLLIIPVGLLISAGLTFKLSEQSVKKR